MEIKYKNTDLRKFINRNRLKDVWRQLHGHQKSYTYFSGRHKNFTRIDYIFVIPEMLSKIMRAEIKMIKISDHAVVTMDMEIDCDYKQASRWRMDLRIFKNKEILEKMERELKEIWTINEEGGSNTGVIWDATKAVVQGLGIKYSYNIKKQKEKYVKWLEEEIRELESKYRIFQSIRHTFSPPKRG